VDVCVCGKGMYVVRGCAATSWRCTSCYTCRYSARMPTADDHERHHRVFERDPGGLCSLLSWECAAVVHEVRSFVCHLIHSCSMCIAPLHRAFSKRTRQRVLAEARPRSRSGYSASMTCTETTSSDRRRRSLEATPRSSPGTAVLQHTLTLD
jgi:hypothetical protein